MACRNKEKTEKAINDIKHCVKKQQEIVFMRLDLADLESVKQFADQFKKRYDKCDILINNAGVILGKRQLSKQNHELTFASNYLGHFFLT